MMTQHILVRHGNLDSVVVSGQRLAIFELAIPKHVFGQQVFADSGHHPEDDSSADDQTDDENPVLPRHWDDAKSSYLQWRNAE